MTPSGRSRTWLRRLGWAVGALIVLELLAWWMVPVLIRSQAPARLSALLGRTVTLGAVDFRPWSLQLGVAQIAVAGSTPEAPLLAIQRVHLDIAASSLWRLAPVIEAFEIDAPTVRITRTADGHYDIDDLIARFGHQPAAPAGGEPMRFALYNLQLRDGQLRFDDQPAGKVHRIEALQLSLPFASDLPAQVDVKVEPRLAFRLNGAAFDSGAQATPFSQKRDGSVHLAVPELDLAPYVGYLPASLPIRLLRGRLSTDLDLLFAAPRGGELSVIVKGEIGATDLALTDAAGAALLESKRIALALTDVQPFARRLALGALRIEGLQLNATRDAAGRINLLGLAAPPRSEKPLTPRALASVPAGSAASAVGATPAPPPWQLTLASLSLADAALRWTDAAVAPAVALQLTDLTATATGVTWPMKQPIPLSIKGMISLPERATQASLKPAKAAKNSNPEAKPSRGASAAPVRAEFSAEGPVTDHSAELALTITGLSLAPFGPYLSQSLLPRLEGRVGGKAKLDWAAAPESPRLTLTVEQLALEALSLHDPLDPAGRNAVSFRQLALANLQVDLLARSVSLGSAKLIEPMLAIAREADGRLNLQRWPVSSPTSQPAAHAVAASAAASPAWQLKLAEASIERGELRFSDASARGPKPSPSLRVAELKLLAQGLQWPADAHAAPVRLQLSARVGTGATLRERATAGGAVDYRGTLALAPWGAKGKLRIERFPLELVLPQLTTSLPFDLRRAEAGYRGDIAVQMLAGGTEVRADGDLLLGDVHIAGRPDASQPDALAGDDLLSWQSLALVGVHFSIGPGTPLTLAVREAALDDAYARLAVTEQGRFNLQSVRAAPAAEVASATAASASASGASVAVASLPLAPSASGTAASASAPSTSAPVDIKIGLTRINNGRIDFSDHFVRPNYSAALTELNGQLGAFDSTSREMATLDLRGRAAGTALLEIRGRVNPGVKPLALDITARATDLELAPLSPYAGKYAGYAIERGKLTMDVAYKIDAEGHLEARNQVVLNQLTFGNRIESKEATKLPVLLAVALLKDRNGVIDINLPVSGSVNDPQFSVGGIIVKVILNLLAKAFTSPFALLSGGGADDLSQVEFVPGTAQVATGGAGAIAKVAKALGDRPALKMTVTGAADPVAERSAYQHAMLESRLLALQRREALRSAAPAAAVASAASASTAAVVALTPEVRARLLAQLYKETDLPTKPRNAIGFAKSLPPQEMEALLVAAVPVNDDLLRELALQRGLAVREALIDKGLTSDRLFLAAPRVGRSEAPGTSGPPSVQLSLSTR